ncbi:50S ribosomal protein L9 [Candidatus Berkelbacteria bacterium]|nr:50S ribosomal protein L9 [Candidatus Berkelbacteria bacterium]
MIKKVKVVLTKDEEKQGQRGDVLEVKKGFFKNFLLPKGLALLIDDPAGKKILKDALRRQERKEAEKEKRAQLLENLISQIKGKTFEIKARADSKGHFFAGIKEERVAEILSVPDLKIEPKQIEMPKIEKLGKYTAKVNFGEAGVVEINLKAI